MPLRRVACALAAASVLAGCGGGAHRVVVAQAPVTPIAVAPAARSAYMWTVRTVGRPPSVAVENAAAGTNAWRLPGPRGLIGGEAHGAIVGYVARDVIAAGEVERVYVSAPGARWVSLRIYRMGWYGGKGGRLVLVSGRLRAVGQPGCAHSFSTGLTECDWRPSLSFRVPSALPSGVFIVKLRGSNGAESDCLFVVRSARAAPVVVEIPTATYEAYNAWGGDSLYPGGTLRVGATGANRGVEVSYDRPYATQTGAGQFFIRDVAIVRFLERYGYPVSYTTIDSIDRDPTQLYGARAVIDVGHSEYWSPRDEFAFTHALDRGANLIFISSDTMAWRVRFARASSASSQAGEADHRIIAYKQNAASDAARAQPTGLYPGGGASLVGSAFDGCITPRVAQKGPPVYRLYEWAPSPALQPRWLFAGTGLWASSKVPGIVGYELDNRSPLSPANAAVVGGGYGAACGRSGEPAPAPGYGAASTLYTARSGAFVFATGTLGWLYALSPVPQASPDAPRAPDPRVVAMTRNVLAHALSSRRARSHASRRP